VQSRSKDGRFYSCPTPDGYSGIVLAGEVKSFAFSGTPFALYGLSPTSQGLNYLANEDAAKRNSQAFFKTVDAVPMHEELAGQPYSPLITLMTVDYLSMNWRTACTERTACFVNSAFSGTSRCGTASLPILMRSLPSRGERRKKHRSWGAESTRGRSFSMPHATESATLSRRPTPPTI
jgi:hypothetical protein